MAQSKNNKRKNKNKGSTSANEVESKVVKMSDAVEFLSERFFQLKRLEYKQKNTRPNSKKIKQQRNYNRKRLDEAYDRDGKRHGKTAKELKGVITKATTMKQYLSQVNDYTDWVAKTYHVTDYKAYRPWMYDDYCNQKVREFHEKCEFASERGLEPSSPAGLLQQRAAIKKFEDIMDVYHLNTHEEGFTYRFYSEGRSTGKKGVFEANDVTRDLRDISRNRPLVSLQASAKGGEVYMADHEVFFRIHAKLKEDNPEFARIWLHQGMVGQRIDAAMNMRKKDVVTSGPYSGIKTEVGKAGKKYETSQVDERYLRELEMEIKGYSDGRLIFSPLKKMDNNDAKNSTSKTVYNKAIRKVAESLGLYGVTSHTARKYYAQCVYDRYVEMSEFEFKKAMREHGAKYNQAFTKDRADLNRKRYENMMLKKTPAGKRPVGEKLQALIRKDMAKDLAEIKKAKEMGYTYKPRYIHTNSDLTQERKSALIVSVETGHERISIMAHYVIRRVAKKKMGENTWFKYKDKEWVSKVQKSSRGI